MLFFKLVRRYRNAVVAEGGGGAAAPAAAPAAPPAAPASAPAAPAAPPTVLGGAAPPPPSPSPAPSPTAGAPTTPPAPAPSQHDWMPEKYRVLNPEGTQIDMEASARKIADAHGHLERKLGSGDVAPKEVSDYKVNVPEALAATVNAEELAKSESLQGMLGKLHAVGASQKVVDVAVAELLQRGMALREAAPALAAAECEAQLRRQEGWKTDMEFARNVGEAARAARSIFGADADGIFKDYGNDPRLIRGLAGIGKEMEEDTGPSPDAVAQLQESLDTLMSSKAYLNGDQATVAKVTALTAKMTGTRNVATGKSMTFST